MLFLSVDNILVKFVVKKKLKIAFQDFICYILIPLKLDRSF